MKSLCAVFILICSACAFADDDASPLRPDDSNPQRLGAFIGYSALWQQGTFSVDCNCNTFQDGAGSGLLIGGLYEASTIGSLTYGAQLGFHHRSLDARYVLNEDTTMRSADGKSVFRNILIPYRHTATVSTDAIFIQPYLRWFPFGQRFFVRVGAAANIVVSSHKEFHKILLSNTVVLPNDDVVQISLDRAAIEASGKQMVNDNEVIVQNGPMSDISAFQLALQPAIGYELKVGKRSFLVPVLEFSLPLSAMSTVDKDFRVPGFHLSAELHFQL